jgi:single-strand DNA-binding protein
MSEGMNEVILMGHLGADPELRIVSNGTALLRFRLATNQTYLDRNKVRQVRTDWHDVTAWGPRAEGLARVLCKGTGVVVKGSLRTSSWEKEGTKHYRTEVVLTDLFFTGSGPSATRSPAPEAMVRATEEVASDLPF